MPSLLTKSLSVALLAAASFAAGAQTLLTQIPLDSFTGDYARIDVAVNSATNRIYVPIQFEDYSGADYNYFRVLVINGATNQVVHNLDDFPSDGSYRAVAIDPVRNFTYVEMTNGAYNQFTVSVIDGQTEDTVKTISLPAGDGGGAMAVDPVTGKVYIRTNNGLDVIESEATGSIETFSLPLPGGPGSAGIAVSPYLHRLYFTYDPSGGGDEYLGFFDTLDNQITQEKHISAEIDYFFNPVVNTATGHIFGTVSYPDFGGDYITIHDSSGNQLATVAHSANILGLDVDPKTNLAFAFVQGPSGYALEVIDGASNTFRSTAPLYLPFAQTFVGGSVAVNPDTSRVYVPYNNTTSYPPPNVSGQFYLNVYSEQ